MQRAIKGGVLKEKFTMHDLRAKCASDIGNEEDAQRLLGHENISMTRKAYIRKPQKVTPLR